MTKLCCLLSPAFVCYTCKLQMCDTCWKTTNYNLNITAYIDHPDREYCYPCALIYEGKAKSKGFSRYAAFSNRS